MRSAAICVLAASLVACGIEGVDDSAGNLSDGTAEAVGILALLNAPHTTLDLLDDDVALDRRAAVGLIDHRDGPDGRYGTADDQPYRSIDEVDAVPWVGRSALDKLLAYSREHGFVPSGSDVLGVFDGVTFTYDEAVAALELVNTAGDTTLRDDVELDVRAVTSISQARPIATLAELADLYYVGKAMLTRIKRFVAAPQIGIISDLDKTVIPPHDEVLPDAPYAGVAHLYSAIDRGAPSDVYYVTARPDSMVEEIPAWLEAKGVPTGLIHTGISPLPHIARAEKVRDILSVFDAHPDQQFVMFGDTNHVDADAFRDVIAARPGRVIAAFVHDVKTIDPARLEGLVLFQDHRSVAAALRELGVIGDATAAAVEREVDSADESLR